MENKSIRDKIRKVARKRRLKRWMALWSAIILLVTANPLVIPVSAEERGVPGGAISGAVTVEAASDAAKPASDDESDEAKSASDDESDEAKPVSDDVSDAAKAASDDVSDEVKPASDDVSDEAKPASDDVSDEAKPASDDVSDEAKPASDDVSDEDHGVAVEAMEAPGEEVEFDLPGSDEDAPAEDESVALPEETQTSALLSEFICEARLDAEGPADAWSIEQGESYRLHLSFKEGEALAFDPEALYYELPAGIRAAETSGETLDCYGMYEVEDGSKLTVYCAFGEGDRRFAIDLPVVFERDGRFDFGNGVTAEAAFAGAEPNPTEDGEQPEIIEEQPEDTEEQPEIIEEQSEATEEQFEEQAEEQPEIIEEQPEDTEEQPEIIEEQAEVQAEDTDEQPEATEEQPEATEEQPEVSEEQSEATEEQPEIIEEKPEDTEEQPEIIEEQPKIIEEQSEDTEEQPEDTDDQSENTEEQSENTEEQSEDTEEQPEDSEEQTEEKPFVPFAGVKTVPVAGADYTLSVRVTEAAMLPEDAEFVATVVEDDIYARAAEDAVDGDATVLALFDLTIYDGSGAVIQPEAAIEVSIDLAVASDMEVCGVHFPGTGDQPEETPALPDEDIPTEAIDVESDEGQLSFTAESFSYYAIVGYTVDFHWDVDGQEYTYSINGGGFISLTGLVDMLGIAEDARVLVKGVEAVVFSDAALVSVSYVEQETTVGDIKDALGLACEYSASLTEADIDAIDAEPVSAGDWALISLKPFTSNEALTVTMKDGESFVVRVTDALSSLKVHYNDSSFGAVYASGNSTSKSGKIDEGGSTTNHMFFWPNDGYDFVKIVVNGETYNASDWSTYGFDTQNIDGKTVCRLLKDSNNNITSQTSGTMNVYFKPSGSYILKYEVEEGGSVNRTDDYATTSAYNAAGVTAITNTGYIFTGWYKGDELFSSAETLTDADLSASRFSADDTVLTAKFRPAAQYTYTYTVNQPGWAIKVTPETETVYEGKSANGSTASTTATNRYFMAWMDADTGEYITDNNTLTFTEKATKDRNFIAVFSSTTKRVLGYSVAPDTITWRTGTSTQSDSVHYIAVATNNAGDGLAGNITYTVNSGYEIENITFNGTDVPTTSWPSSEKISKYIVEKWTEGTNTLIIYTRPSSSTKILYKAEGNGFVSSACDYVGGSVTPTGAVATPASGEYFLGWYFSNGTLATSSDTIGADDLNDWLSHNLIHEGDALTARFGAGYWLTYQQQLDGDAATDLDTEHITTNSPAGYTAQPVSGYNFLGWYEGETLITAGPALTSDLIGAVSADRTFTAKYAATHVATYAVEHRNAPRAESIYGQVVVNGETTTTQTTQNANADNSLPGGATAIPARGCAFDKWEVTDADGTLTDNRVREKYGFDPTSAVVPAGTVIPSDVTFKAQFAKQEGAMEIIYTIQQDEDPDSHAAKLTVGSRSVQGEGNTTAYISEVVPDGQPALGCSAEGLVYSGQQYEIRGWVLGDDNAPNKDTLFTRTSSFTPAGEYLEDIDHNGVRYFRVVTKKSKNIYIMFKVDLAGAGSIGHTSGEPRMDVLIYVNSEDIPSHRTRDEIFTNDPIYKRDDNGDFVLDVENNKIKIGESRGLSWNNVYVNKGYKLVGFTYNGVDLDLVTPKTVSGSAPTVNAGAIAEGVFEIEAKNGYTDLVTYMDNKSDLFLDSTKDKVDRHVNILIARFEIEGYNIEYHVKGGVGGAVSNSADGYTTAEKTKGEKADESALIKGSTAIPDAGEDYVFVRWEDAAGNPVSTNPKYVPAVTDITSTEITYHYYAVFDQRDALTVLYEPDDPAHGMTTPDRETVHQGVAANGSLATATEGYVFSHWTRKGSEDVLSTDPGFVPNIDGVSDADTDYVTAADFAAKQPVTFVAHFNPAIDSRITVTKVVRIPEGDTLKAADIDTTIYISLTRKGQPVYERDGVTLMVKEIRVVGGEAQNTAVFEGLPYNDLSDSSDKYELWEMHKVGSVYERQYVGMLIGDNYQLTGIATTNNSAYSDGVFSEGSGNNALLTEEHKSATVTLTNTYSAETETVSFEVSKEWQNSDGTVLTGEAIPTGAQVELMVYSETVNGEGVTVTHAVKSITLDGNPDENGEQTAWKATFSNLPKLADGGKYKVREISTWPGYKPFINGSTYMSESVYLYNSGGKIVNRAVADTATIVTVHKVDAEDDTLLGGATFTLERREGSEYAEVESGRTYVTGSAEHDGLGMFSVALTDGEYRLTETSAPTNYRMLDAPVKFTVDNGTVTLAQGTSDGVATAEGAVITVKNSLASVRVAFTKVSVDNMDENAAETPLSGATFRIHIGTKDGALYTDGAATTFTSNDAGTLLAASLPLGTYYLEETHTPDGYNALEGMLMLTVGADDVTIGSDGASTTMARSKKNQDGSYTVTIRNMTAYALPSTGGSGTTAFTAFGLGLVALALLLLLRRSRRE